jgi:hypothetical protein
MKRIRRSSISASARPPATHSGTNSAVYTIVCSIAARK